MNELEADAGAGLRIDRIGEAEFRDFARLHGSSPEIGAIATYVDAEHGERTYGEPFLFGLTGCGVLCAVACCTVSQGRDGASHACKLDSIIVHQATRRGGLGAALVARAFQQMLSEPGLRITSFFSYAVHPATAAMLRRLGFSAPPQRGAPLSSLEIAEGDRERVATLLKVRFQDAVRKPRLNCVFCQRGSRRAQPWCALKRA